MKIQKLLLFVLSAVAGLCLAGSGSAAETNGRLVLTPENVRIVVARDAPDSVRRIAAVELGYLLGQVLETKIKVVETPEPDTVSIFLGAASGFDVEDFARDQFRVRIDATGVRIAGRDGLEPRKAWTWERAYERATLFGVYDFLEREVGMRFYFPGELGTIVPKAKRLVLPFVERTVRPRFAVRRYGYMDGTFPSELKEKDGLMAQGDDMKTVNRYRLRMETESIPCSHGQLHSKFYRRFAKTHPEYFRMGKDGKRILTEAVSAPLWSKEHLCQSSAIWDVLYEDAKCYLTGGSADERQIPSRHKGRTYDWPLGAVGRKYYDVMPHDGFQPCCCTACSNNYDRTRTNYATELIWGRTAALANRLKAEGVKGCVTQMAYHPYGDVPKVDIPDNVLVMVAHSGPWTAEHPGSFNQGLALVRDWTKKLGHPVWMWTYPDKIFRTDFPDIPQMSPHGWAKYYGTYAPYITGAFCESESDRWMYNHLNYYVFSRVCWDADLDVDAVLDEYYRLMYGKGAPYVKRFFESLEKKWLTRMIKRADFNQAGPNVTVPGEYEIWMDIYSSAVLAEYEGWLSAAEKAVVPGSLEARRLELVRREFLTPLAARAAKKHDAMSVEKGLAKRAGRPDRSMLRNGDCESTEKWEAIPAGATKLSLDATTFVTGQHSFKMTTGATNEYSFVRQYCRFKPGTKYRVSYFQKLQDVKPIGEVGGVYCEYYDGGWHWFPRDEPAMNGTTDWVYREYDFEIPEKPAKGAHFFHFYFSHAVGTAWFDDVRIEELLQDAVIKKESVR